MKTYCDKACSFTRVTTVLLFQQVTNWITRNNEHSSKQLPSVKVSFKICDHELSWRCVRQSECWTTSVNIMLVCPSLSTSSSDSLFQCLSTGMYLTQGYREMLFLVYLWRIESRVCYFDCCERFQIRLKTELFSLQCVVNIHHFRILDAILYEGKTFSSYDKLS